LREALTDYKYSFAGGGFGAFLIDRWISFKKMNTIFAASNRLPTKFEKTAYRPVFYLARRYLPFLFVCPTNSYMNTFA